MRKRDLLEDLQLAAAPPAVGRRRPFADPVDGEDGCMLEGGGEEGAGGVRFVVLGEDETLAIGAAE